MFGVTEWQLMRVPRSAHGQAHPACPSPLRGPVLRPESSPRRSLGPLALWPWTPPSAGLSLLAVPFFYLFKKQSFMSTIRNLKIVKPVQRFKQKSSFLLAPWIQISVGPSSAQLHFLRRPHRWDSVLCSACLFVCLFQNGMYCVRSATS